MEIIRPNRNKIIPTGMIIITSLHHHINTLPHYHIFTLSHLHITPSSHHHIITSPHHHIPTSSHLHIIISSFHHITTLSHHHITPSSHYHIITFLSPFSPSSISTFTRVSGRSGAMFSDHSIKHRLPLYRYSSAPRSSAS